MIRFALTVALLLAALPASAAFTPPPVLERPHIAVADTCFEPTMAADRHALAKAALARWQHDPVRFADEVLGVKTWDRQAETMQAIVDHSRVAVRSGHKVGKSTAAAAVSLWWVTTRPRATVVMTSASYRQVKGILWKELKRLHREARIPIGGKLADDPERGLQFADGREIVGLSTKEPERIAGYSGANLLFIPDEASGIDEAIFEAIEGNRAGGAKLLMYSNPTRTSGTFFDAFHSKQAYWKTIHISSEETPNVVAGREIIPGLAGLPWIEEKRSEWSEDSPLYAVRVRGDFPAQATNAIIGLVIVEDARRRYDHEDPTDGRLEVGVDVARYGDDESVIQPIRGNRTLEPKILQSMDTVQVAGAVREHALALRKAGEKPRVKVDVIGVGGGVADILRQDKELEVVDVNVSSAPTRVPSKDHPGYALLRDQLWFEARDWLRDGGQLHDDGKLAAELTAPTYTFDMKGRFKVESKDAMKKRLPGNRSPDRADALCLAIHVPNAVEPYTPTRVRSRWS